MLKEIAIVTLTVANLAQVESAWLEQFGYQVADRGKVSSELTDLWKAPDTRDSEFVLLHPGNDTPTYLRLVQAPGASDIKPMTSQGWNATELLVADTDAVADRLRDTAFNIVGEPKDLWQAPDAPRAMQAIGPGNELLYLTTNVVAKTALGLDDNMPLIERIFIMIVGGPSMDKSIAFYRDQMGLQVDEPQSFKITSISKANSLPLDTSYPLATVRLAPGYLIELDELPSSIGPRVQNPGGLPAGIAIVGFNVDAMPETSLEWFSKPRAMTGIPYHGRHSAIIRGPSGELIELIEAQPRNTAANSNEQSGAVH